MNEIKRPKTPLIFYYLVVLLIIMLVNALVMPKIAEHAVQEVDYGTFMSMTENGEIGKVQLQSNQILFTNKDETTVYKTGLMNDPGLVERLYASGAEFTSEIIEQASPLVTLLFSRTKTPPIVRLQRVRKYHIVQPLPNREPKKLQKQNKVKEGMQ